MEIDKILQSRKFVIVMVTLFGLALMVGVFIGGVAVGLHKARFSYAWGDNYERNFVGPRSGPMGMMRGFFGRDLFDAHGSAGDIIKIADNTLTIKENGNTEKSVLVGDGTTIQQFRQTIKLSDLKTGDRVVVIGEPNDQGQIEAKFIRVMPLVSPTP